MNSKYQLSRKKEIVIHLLFWVIYLYFYLIHFDSSGKLQFDFGLFNCTWILIFSLTFYLNYLLILPRVYRKFTLKKAFIGLLLLFVFFIGIRYTLEQLITNLIWDETNYYTDTNLLFYALDNLYFGSQPIIISSVMWLVISFIRLSQYNAYIAEEQKNAEIKFLKAQINPHFLFNTLNNIYSMVYVKSDRALEAIEKLSDIMRFTTYESQKNKIEIEQEIAYIQSLIELESLRHSTSDFIDFTIENQSNKKVWISPYVLSPLVENALKHAEISNEDKIQIRLKYTDVALEFIVKNKIGNHQKDEVGGVGLDNLQKRLQINYPDKHQWKTREENQVFTALLTLQLHEK